MFKVIVMSDVLWLIFELFMTLAESFIVMRFICKFHFCDLANTKNITVLCTGSIMCCTLVSILNRITIYEGWLGIIYVLFFVLFAVVFLEGTFLKKLFAAVIANVVLVCSNALVSSIVSAIFRNNISHIYTEQTISRLSAMICVQLLEFYFFSLILKIADKTTFPLNSKEWRLIISVFMISFVALVFIHMANLGSELSDSSAMLILLAECGIILMNILCFYMTITLSKSNKENEELRLQRQQHEYHIQYAENVKTQYNEIRSIRHDIKQHFSTIAVLCQDGKHQEAIEYINKYTENISNMEILVDVGNDFVNAILNSKMSIAKEHGIKIICGSPSKITGVEDIDLCNLLGNMLDNAIEACNNITKSAKSINISLISDEYKIIVIVSNSIDESVLAKNPMLLTNKQHKKHHGFGMKTIRSVAEKYNGSVDYFEADEQFHCRVLLYKNNVQCCLG